MAYVVRRRDGSYWELRETRSTPKGPRSRTLASFRTLSDETIERARARSTKSLTPEEIRSAAHRAGAPVALAKADRAAGDLLRELAAGRELHPTLRMLLEDALQTDVGSTRPLDNAQASAAWLSATPTERGNALHDLLLLTDAIPHRPRREADRFPRLKAVA
jgi:hypothetical protein